MKERAMPYTMVIFGASGDLTSRKLIPALYNLFRRKRLPAGTRIVGVSRTPFSHDDWRKELTATTEKFAKRDFTAEVWNAFAENIFYHSADITNADDFPGLATALNEIEQNKPSQRIYYLSTMPQLYAQAAQNLGNAGLADDKTASRRVVIEKPFGTDLQSCRALNQIGRAHV